MNRETVSFSDVMADVSRRLSNLETSVTELRKETPMKTPVADALRDTLISPNVSDSNMEDANIVDVVDRLGRRVVAGFEMLGTVKDGCDNIALAIRELAEAMQNMARYG
jgi:hypothetical protein